MKWWKVVVTAIGSLLLLWRERFSRTSKARRQAYEQVEKKIDNDADTSDVNASVNDIINGL